MRLMATFITSRAEVPGTGVSGQGIDDLESGARIAIGGS